MHELFIHAMQCACITHRAIMRVDNLYLNELDTYLKKHQFLL